MGEDIGYADERQQDADGVHENGKPLPHFIVILKILDSVVELYGKRGIQKCPDFHHVRVQAGMVEGEDAKLRVGQDFPDPLRQGVPERLGKDVHQGIILVLLPENGLHTGMGREAAGFPSRSVRRVICAFSWRKGT